MTCRDGWQSEKHSRKTKTILRKRSPQSWKTQLHTLCWDGRKNTSRSAQVKLHTITNTTTTKRRKTVDRTNAIRHDYTASVSHNHNVMVHANICMWRQRKRTSVSKSRSRTGAGRSTSDTTTRTSMQSLKRHCTPHSTIYQRDTQHSAVVCVLFLCSVVLCRLKWSTFKHIMSENQLMHT